MIERDLLWADTVNGRIERSAIISASPSVVWSVLADHEGWSQWFPGLTRVSVPEARVDAVGGTRRAQTGPVRLDERYLAWEPGRRFAFTGTSMTPPAFRSIVEDVRLEETDDGRSTQVSYAMSIELAPVLAPFGPVIRRVTGTMLSRGISGLASAAENRS